MITPLGSVLSMGRVIPKGGNRCTARGVIDDIGRGVVSTPPSERTTSDQFIRAVHHHLVRYRGAEVNAERSRLLSALEHLMAATGPEVSPAPQDSPADDGGMQ